ncbi:DUF5060 domain-containing protein [Rhodocaloribacter litoris]|uniref:DUF5060 domain-containing protein n=1 Tax=Rhodocaloribacter litoris TaxID=2558931 RepID=UPI001E405DDB|nr:DUF5060 domain-containing protein [Rhodocaloribacter litoris]QXD16197.1 DUF5060 domain-containing protein [Rhodocaloribacter litoris]
MHDRIRIFLFLFILAHMILPGAAGETRVQQTNTNSLDRTGTLWAPYLEWEVENPSYSGNPFDLVATVTFTHSASGATHTTEMFYDGGDTWKWRFTGTEVGTWTFESASADAELDGLSGTVTINPNPDTEAYGFVTEYESATHTKWARQKGNDGEIEAFVPQFRMGFEKKNSFNWSSAEIDGYLDQWMTSEGFNGVFVFMAGYWVDINATGADFTNNDPDMDSFRVLEEIITKVYARGGVVHIWYNGDCKRSQCVEAGFGEAGASTIGEQRLLRYIAARLGPLPGWIMGYGYDLHEFADVTELNGWGTYLREHMGWQHPLGARDQGENINYTFWPGADWYSRGNWFNGVDYNATVAVIESDPTVPHSFDERWYASRMDEESQRRQLWTLVMAGGVSAIWGWDGSYKRDPYSNPHWFKTHFVFWENRFLNDMEPCSELSDGYCLGDPARASFVFYKEETDQIQGDLTGVLGQLDVVFVDTKAPYVEVDGCEATAGLNVWELPYVSDWAVAVGTFGGGTSSSKASRASDCSQLPVELTRFEAVSDGRDVLLAWATASETDNAGFEVQQRSTGDTAFRTVRFVDGQGTTSEPQTYELRLSDLPPGTYTFRLRQVDFDGSFAYSPEVTLAHAVTGSLELEPPFPNPFQGRATLRLAVARPQGVQVMLYDATGRHVRTILERTVEPNTEHDIVIEAENLPAGMYFVRVRGEQFLRTVPVVLVR